MSLSNIHHDSASGKAKLRLVRSQERTIEQIMQRVIQTDLEELALQVSIARQIAQRYPALIQSPEWPLECPDPQAAIDDDMWRDPDYLRNVWDAAFALSQNAAA